jgi:hypothetical protein
MNPNEDRKKRINGEKSQTPRVSLKDIIEAMDMQSDSVVSYLNIKTGKTMSILTEGDIESKDYEDFYGQEAAEEARAVFENKETYVALPDRFEINEYGMMEEFASNLPDVKTSNTLLVTIQGPGAFRRFRDMIKILEIEKDWYDFQGREYAKIAIEWCEDNGIEYER